jgi:hypothetical protein
MKLLDLYHMPASRLGDPHRPSAAVLQALVLTVIGAIREGVLKIVPFPGQPLI